MKPRSASLKTDLEARYGLVMSATEIGEAIGIRSRSSLDRWMRAEEKEGLPLLRFASRKGRFVLTADLANWLVRKRQSTAGK